MPIIKMLLNQIKDINYLLVYANWNNVVICIITHLTTRRREASGKGRGHEVVREGPKESKAVPAPDFNAELQASIQV